MTLPPVVLVSSDNRQDDIAALNKNGAAGTTTTASTSTASRLSCLLNQAIQSMQTQDYSEAIGVLLGGIDILDEYDCPQEFDKEEEEDQMMSKSNPFGKMQVTMIPLDELPDNEPQRRRLLVVDQEQTMLVFRQAFFMKVEDSSTGWDLLTEDQYDAYGCLFLYNLGLSRQLASIADSRAGEQETPHQTVASSPDRSSLLVQQQEQALEDYRGAGCWLHGVPGQAFQWLTLALANNACLIECQFFLDRPCLLEQAYESLETIQEQLSLLIAILQAEKSVLSPLSFRLLRDTASNCIYFRNALSATTSPMA